MKRILSIGVALISLLFAGIANAAFTLPELPVTNLEAAGVAVAALVAAYVVIRMAIRMIKGA